MVKNPIEAEGAIRIATNKEIPVEVIGTGVVTEIDIANRVVLPVEDYAALIRKAKRCIELEKLVKELQKQTGKGAGYKEVSLYKGI